MKKNKATTLTITQPTQRLTKSMTVSDWQAYGRTLLQLGEQLRKYTTHYQITAGAWYAHGADHFKETALFVARDLGYSVETLQNWAYVARRIPAEYIAQDGLTFEHYRTLAAIRDEKARGKLIDETIEKGWTAGELKRQITKSSPQSPTGDADEDDGLANRWIKRATELSKSSDPLTRAQADILFACAHELDMTDNPGKLRK